MANKILSRVKKVVGFGGAGLAALVNLGCATPAGNAALMTLGILGMASDDPIAQGLGVASGVAGKVGHEMGVARAGRSRTNVTLNMPEQRESYGGRGVIDLDRPYSQQAEPARRSRNYCGSFRWIDRDMNGKMNVRELERASNFNPGDKMILHALFFNEKGSNAMIVARSPGSGGSMVLQEGVLKSREDFLVYGMEIQSKPGFGTVQFQIEHYVNGRKIDYMDYSIFLNHSEGGKNGKEKLTSEK